jgi:hypothetical protein
MMMTPREKAYKICDDLCWAMGYGNLEKEVKAAALFTVNEIIDIYWNQPGCGIGSKLEYWKKVKREINKL